MAFLQQIIHQLLVDTALHRSLGKNSQNRSTSYTSQENGGNITNLKFIHNDE
jgi:hypothetical protein